MGAKTSVASLLLSIVVATPCMRNNLCAPGATAPSPGPPTPRQQAPSSPVKPTSGVAQANHPCVHHADMAAKHSGHRA